VAACLEAAYDAAEVFFHLLFDEDDAVEMVGHHLEGNDFDLGVVAGNAPPFVMDTLTEGREFHPWGIGLSSGASLRPTTCPNSFVVADGAHLFLCFAVGVAVLQQAGFEVFGVLVEVGAQIF
jgi:hypothetical protein